MSAPPRPEASPSLPDLLSAAIGSHFAEQRGPIPGIVAAYSPLPVPSATVSLALQLYVEGELTAVPAIQSIPVVYPGGSLGSFTAPLAPGDGVLLIPNEADFSSWMVTGTLALPPQTQRRYTLGDLVAIPGLRAMTQPLPPDAVDAVATVVRSLDVRLGSSLAISPVALAVPNDANWTALATWAGNVVAVLAALGITIPPLAPPTTTAATQVKAI